MKIEFTLTAFQKERSVTQYLSFIYYLLVFQCIFLIIPMNFFNILYYFPQITYVFPILGTVLLIILPPLFVILLNRFLKKRTPQDAYNAGAPAEAQGSGWLDDDSSSGSKSLKNKTLPFLYGEFRWILGLILVSILGLFAQFILYSHIFDDSTWFSYLLMNSMQIISLSLAIIAGKRLHTPRRSDMGAFWAAIFIGIIWLFAYINIQAVYLGSALLLAFCGFCLFVIRQGIVTQNPDFNYTSQKIDYPRFGWVKANSPHHSLVITFGWMLALFWILCFSSLPAILYYGTSIDGTIHIGYLCLTFFISMACGQKIAEAKLIAAPIKGFVVIIVLYGAMLGLTEVIVPLKYSIYEQILSGFSLGVLVALRIGFKNYNPHSGPTLFYGVSWSILWSTTLGWTATLYVSFSEDLQFLSGRLLVVAVFGFNILLIVLFELIRGKIIQTKDVQKAKADKLLNEMKKPVESNPSMNKEYAWGTEPAKNIKLPPNLATNSTEIPKLIEETSAQKDKVLLQEPPQKVMETEPEIPLLSVKTEPSLKPTEEPIRKPAPQDQKIEVIQSLKEELISKAEELDAPKININASQKIKIDLSKPAPKPKMDDVKESDIFWEDEPDPTKTSEKK